jgi:hypothetical protein
VNRQDEVRRPRFAKYSRNAKPCEIFNYRSKYRLDEVVQIDFQVAGDGYSENVPFLEPNQFNTALACMGKRLKSESEDCAPHTMPCSSCA